MIRPEDHVDGPGDAPLLLVEYGDFECPYCGAAYPEVEAVREALRGRLRFVFRHFPIAAAHPHALEAAEAAEAAGAQGRFWEMHASLFQDQGSLGRRALVARAEDLGLDVDRFRRELDEHVHLPRVRGDFRLGVREGVAGTPGFLANGRILHGPHDRDGLLAALEASPAIRA